MLKADFHLHTNREIVDRISHSPQELIKYMSRLGFKVISMTNHNYFYYNNDIAGYAKKHGILLMPGIECTIQNKHVITLNSGRNIKSFSELEKIKDENNIILAAHPFFPHPHSLGKNLIENIETFDAIEFNAFYTKNINFNRKAVDTAKRYKKPLLGCTDGHFLWQLNKTYTLIDAEPNIDSVLEAIRKNKVKVVTRPLGALEFLKAGILVQLTSIK